MKVVGFDGREYSYRLKYKDFQKSTNYSGYHGKVRKLLNEMFDAIVEELPLKGSKTEKNRTLAADFYIPSHNLIIEVHGEQHYKYIPHFHKTKLDYVKSLGRDRTKIKWCNMNNIDIVVLKYDEEDKWRDQIENRGRDSETSG